MMICSVLDYEQDETMISKNRDIVIILMILALFTGATIELSEGSTLAGIILFAIAAILITQIKLPDTESFETSGRYLLLGTFIVLADIAYNLREGSTLGSLDTMTFFFGVSLIAYGTNIPQLKHIGEFGAYISGIFLPLYIVFYIFFEKYSIEFIHLFDHYLILLPTVAIVKLFGMPLEVIATETVRLSGVEDMTIVIGGPCSGLYSMFLLIGIVVGYSRIEKMDLNKTLYLTVFAILIAYISNLVRVIVLYATAYFYGVDAMMTVHTHIGWIIFAVVAAGIMYLMDVKK